MTCIVGIGDGKEVWIGGDSAGVAGLDVTVRKDSKVFQVGKFLIGYTSSFRMGQILRFHLKVEHQECESDYEYMCTSFISAVREVLGKEGYMMVDSNRESIGTFIVGYKGTIYSVYDDLQIAESIDGYDSVGCGANYALGALDNLKSGSKQSKITRALETAVKFSGGVRPPFNILKLKA